MKRMLTGLLLLLFCPILHMQTAALSYRDEMDSAAQNTVKSYTNLKSFTTGTGRWNLLPDTSAFSFASTSTPIGYANYRVQNASQVTVGFYTLTGSFYLKDPNLEDEWILGLYSSNASDIADMARARHPQASYSPSNDSIYANIDGTLRKGYFVQGGVRFYPSAESPSDLVGYGVNVYASSDGKSWTRLSLSRTALSFQQNDLYVYEEMSGSVPGGTTYLRVELNDASRYTVWSGGTGGGSIVDKAPTTYNCLASVTIEGDGLILGTPEPVQPEPVLPGQEESESSSQGITIGSWPQKSSKSSSGASEYSGPKFEGSIEASSKASKSAAAGKSSKSSAGRTPSAEQEDEPLEPVIRAQEDGFYQIAKRDGANGYFTAGITAYIIGVAGVLFFILLRSAGKKK